MLFRENYSMIGLRQRRAHLMCKVTKKSEISTISDKDNLKQGQDSCIISSNYLILLKNFD